MKYLFLLLLSFNSFAVTVLGDMAYERASQYATRAYATSLTAGFALGTAALPTIYPLGDPDTGIWSTGTNTIVFSTNGAERARFDAANLNVTGNILNTGGFDITSSNNLNTASGGKIQWSSRSALTSPSDGIIRLTNQASTDFTRLQFGGTTSSFPSLKRSSTGLDVRLADDSDFAPVQFLYHRFGSGTPEGVVTAPVGAIYSRTNGGAGTSLYVKESGTGNTGWVAK